MIKFHFFHGWYGPICVAVICKNLEQFRYWVRETHPTYRGWGNIAEINGIKYYAIYREQHTMGRGFHRIMEIGEYYLNPNLLEICLYLEQCIIR